MIRGHDLGQTKTRRRIHFLFLPLSFFLVEVFAFLFLSLNTEEFRLAQFWPLAFGALWAAILSGFVRLFPAKAGEWCTVFCISSPRSTPLCRQGIFICFPEMMWLSDFRYASEGSDYFSVLLSYPHGLVAGTGGAGGAGYRDSGEIPKVEAEMVNRNRGCGGGHRRVGRRAACRRRCLCRTATSGTLPPTTAESSPLRRPTTIVQCPPAVIRSAACTRRWKRTSTKTAFYPLTPPPRRRRQESGDQRLFCGSDCGRRQRNDRPAGRKKRGSGAHGVHGRLDDRGSTPPTLERLMSEGISFTHFYTPGYGGIRTFTSGVLREYRLVPEQSGRLCFRLHHEHLPLPLASLLTQEGYSAKTFHYNDPSFYSRGSVLSCHGVFLSTSATGTTSVRTRKTFCMMISCCLTIPA